MSPVEILLAESGDSIGKVIFQNSIGPIGVVVGACIAAYVAWWNGKKSVYDRLQTLLKVRDDWPGDLPGKDTVDRSIAIALAEIRRKEPGHPPPSTTEAARKADAEVRSAFKWLIFRVFAVSAGTGVLFAFGLGSTYQGYWSLAAAAFGIMVLLFVTTSLREK
ncbi:hypothetical protein [Mycobacteroides abscessus]|uniref:hypothetical protein n=1 Tax=Mycobacteroides abscessus TaxID=36809 RepID=UPI00092919B7|nr:hypothetical protein [Mycobacteroides abscessus]QSM04890.1 hypothetical protein PROPHIGD91-4_39 [Mycobacterium phage prophi91-4]MDO3335137.1 hypothetical protein [Mycobacteroides abscessus subsp. bolletii]QSM87827.1 hypothetical protein I3U44_18695 [Mycobacteroides abscessus subsp. bolletii]SIB01279.1 Uncharacterised protein [Mycobacteroides abscessus subsp. bolletii]SII69793.1 Uncharacterised protein [Mycobacteroides abscessus subsp. bolletii]